MTKRTKKGRSAKTAPRHTTSSRRSPLRGLAAFFQPPGHRAVLAGVVWAVLLATATVAAVSGLRHVERRLYGQDMAGDVEKVFIRLRGRPAWLPRLVACDIAAACQMPEIGFYDSGLTQAVYGAAAQSPWVKKVVSVRKSVSADGTEAYIDIACEYRKPVARVWAAGDGVMAPSVAYVDAEGYRLPTAQVPKIIVRQTGLDGQVRIRTFCDGEEIPHGERSEAHYPLIDGVYAGAPAVGSHWPGDELAAGLRLVGLIDGKPYASQITVVDVGNYDGRLDPALPHLFMTAQADRGPATMILFGRFPATDGLDYVVSPARKIDGLDKYASEHNGQLAGFNRKLDLQCDEPYASLD